MHSPLHGSEFGRQTPFNKTKEIIKLGLTSQCLKSHLKVSKVKDMFKNNFNNVIFSFFIFTGKLDTLMLWLNASAHRHTRGTGRPCHWWGRSPRRGPCPRGTCRYTGPGLTDTCPDTWWREGPHTAPGTGPRTPRTRSCSHCTLPGYGNISPMSNHRHTISDVVACVTRKQ